MTVFAQTTRIFALGLLTIVPWQIAAAQSHQTRRIPAPIQALPAPVQRTAAPSRPQPQKPASVKTTARPVTTKPASTSSDASPLKKTTWMPVDNHQGASSPSTSSSNEKTSPSQVSQASHEVMVDDPTMTMVPQPMVSQHGCGGSCDGGCSSCQAASSCDSHGQACGCNRCSAANYWVRAEYLAWSLDGMELPPLVTTSTGTTPANTGILGGGTTRVLFGGDTINDDLRSGGRITLGWWADAAQSCGYEVGYLSVGRAGDDFSVSSTDVARIARPVFDTALNAESAFLVAHPDFLTGSVSVTTESQLQSIDVIRRQCLRSSRWDRVDFLIGFKHGMLDELVRIDQSSRYTVAQGQILAGTTRQLFDKFETDNQFDGLQLGLNWQQRGRAFTLSALAKVSLGVNRAEVTIDGRTTNTVPGGGAGSFTGGLLAQSTNIGSFDDTNFIALPELGINLGYHISPRAQLSVGYNAMYWSKVARAGDQIDRSVSQFPPELPSGQRRPALNFVTDDLFIHGLNAGLTYRF